MRQNAIDAIGNIHLLAARALNTAVDLSARIGTKTEFDQLIRQIGETVSAAACASSGSAAARRRRDPSAGFHPARPQRRHRRGAIADCGLRLIPGGLR